MPCTFSHPLAVVPLYRRFPAWLNFAALVIGSMSPDFGYYVRQFPVARIAHTLAGTFIICLPTGLSALGLFYLLRQPLCFILPLPHRAALMPLAAGRPRTGPRDIFIAAVSVLIGAWTHTVWDSFTHDGGWSVEHLLILRAVLLRVGGTSLPAFYIFQQLSTFGAGMALASMYLFWLRRQSVTPSFTPDSVSDRWRYVLIGSLAAIAFAIAVPAALRTASLFDGYTAFRVFMFRLGIYSAAVFVPLFTLCSVILYTAHRRSA